MANDRGDHGYRVGEDLKPTFLEPRHPRKEERIIELSDDESGIPEVPVVHEQIPRKKPGKKKPTAQNLAALEAQRQARKTMPRMQEQDRAPSASVSVAPPEPEPEEVHEQAESQDVEAEEEPTELRLSVDSSDEQELTADQQEALELAEEVIQGQ